MFDAPCRIVRYWPLLNKRHIFSGMFDLLVNFIGNLDHWGYLVIFLVVALECQAVLGLVMPGESLVLMGGFFAEQGVFELPVLIMVISLAAVVGDSIGFQLGRKLGRGWLAQYGARFGLRHEHLDRVDGFFVKHGGEAVFSSHFLHLLRSLMPFIAGSRRMPYLKFLSFNAAGCIVWASMFTVLGYLAGKSWRIAAKWIGGASEIVGAVLVLLILVILIWRHLERHENDVKRRWQAVTNHPHTAALRRGFAPQLEFLLARLSPRGFLGLHLTSGILILIGASWLFGGIAQDVVAGDQLTIIDKNLALWFHRSQTSGLTTMMQIVSSLASTRWVTGLALAIGLFLCWKQYWYRLLALLLVLPCGMILNVLLKITFHRQRPSFADSYLIFHGYSFPSGHTMAATLLYGLLAVFAVIAIKKWRWRVAAALCALVMVLLVGLSRIFLGAHYLSDVLGAFAAGMAWLALSLTAVDTFRRNRARRK
jgi:membrane protein DedA with SNARE-associated domain/membrane-associated phospholipid phosphatase